MSEVAKLSMVASGAGGQPETSGANFYAIDAALRSLLDLYAPADQVAHLRDRFHRLGALVGDELDELARTANRHPPTLAHRDRQGRDRQAVVKHPAYREMERIAFGELELAALAHRPAFGWHEPLHPAIKYALTYLFAQSEFGLLCPVNMTDSLTRTLRRFADATLLERYLPALLEHDAERLHQGAMFITEREAGSDVGAVATRAVRDGRGAWRLYGEKWFCSNADADLALVLARPDDAPSGTKGLGLFLMPRVLPDGEPNWYRIVRLKDKLGTRSMASGEIVLEGATAYLIGDPHEGFAQMAEMINHSRLSNAVRSAGMMRRACHEALAVARGRQAFGRRLLDLPLMQRQLTKMLLPTEAALSMVFFAADALHRADEGDRPIGRVVRILTPLMKFRACRDARRVTGDAMEVRGGCGYIEEWAEPRLLRDSHLGSIWEGTSNIVALDVLRAARKQEGHLALRDALLTRLERTDGVPGGLAGALHDRLARATAFVEEAATREDGEQLARQAASGLYYAAAAILLAVEGIAIARRSGDATRLLWSAMIVREKLSRIDPLSSDTSGIDRRVVAAALAGRPVTLESVLEVERPV